VLDLSWMDKDFKDILVQILIEAGLIEGDVDPAQLIAKTQQLGDYVEELKSAGAIANRTRTQLTQKEAELADLEAQMKARNDEMEKYQETIMEFEQKIKQLEQAAKAKEEEKWAAKQATQEAESKANNLEYEKRNIMLDSKKVSTKTAQLAEQNAQQAAELIYLKDRIKTLQSHLETLKVKTDEFRKENFAKIEKATDDFKQRSEENVKLKKDLAGLQRESKALNNLTVDAVKSGWLIYSEKGKVKKDDKKQWVVLNGVKLEYFKSDKPDEKSRGLIPIDKCKIATLAEPESLKKYGASHVIELNHENGKVYYFFAAGQPEKKQWMDTLKSNRMKHVARADRSLTMLSPKGGPQAPPDATKST